MGTLERIWIKRAHRGVMDPAPSATLVEGRGVSGSANYGGRRHVTLIFAERWAELAAQLGVAIEPSARRANLMVTGIDLVETRGRVLQIGRCLLRIGGETRPCERMEEAHLGLQAALRERWGGGAWAQVVRGGDVHIGDEVTWSRE